MADARTVILSSRPIIENLAHDCRTNQEEIFGPVVTVTPFDTEEEVLGYANSVEYGLSATVWTENFRARTAWPNTRKRNRLGQLLASPRFANAVRRHEKLRRRTRRRLRSAEILHRRKKCLHQDKLLKIYNFAIICQR